MCSHVLDQPREAAQRSAGDTHPIAGLKPIAGPRLLRQPDQAVTPLAQSQLLNYPIGNVSRLLSVHEQPHDARRPSRRVPLQLVRDEDVGREQRYAGPSRRINTRLIDRMASETKAVQR
jgi:hypothetical protein